MRDRSDSALPSISLSCACTGTMRAWMLPSCPVIFCENNYHHPAEWFATSPQIRDLSIPTIPAALVSWEQNSDSGASSPVCTLWLYWTDSQNVHFTHAVRTGCESYFSNHFIFKCSSKCNTLAKKHTRKQYKLFSRAAVSATHGQRN